MTNVSSSRVLTTEESIYFAAEMGQNNSESLWQHAVQMFFNATTEVDKSNWVKVLAQVKNKTIAEK